MAENGGKAVSGLIGGGIGFLLGWLMKKKPPPAPPTELVYVEDITIDPQYTDWILPLEEPDFFYHPVTIVATVVNLGEPQEVEVICQADNELMSQYIFVPTQTPTTASFTYTPRSPYGRYDEFYRQHKVSVYIEGLGRHGEVFLQVGG